MNGMQKESQQDLEFHSEDIDRGPWAKEGSDFMGLSGKRTVDIVHSDWEEQEKLFLPHVKLELTNLYLQRDVWEREA